ncbi:hypothetical protein GBA52_004257 [Prunus armeniaca]|nr:hypothetical protein GBA52_004257 [Prunus armeniaca]
MYYGADLVTISMLEELSFLEGIILYYYKLPRHSNSLTLQQYDENVVDMCALDPEFKEIEIYLEHLDSGSKESQFNSTMEKKCKILIEEIHEEHPLEIILSRSKTRVDNGVESGYESGVETGNVTGKAVVTKPYDSSNPCNGYPSDYYGLVDIGYVMRENDDINLNTLFGDD